MNLKERLFWMLVILSLFLSISFADLQIRTNLINSTAYLKNLVLTTNGLTNGTHKINLDGSNGNVWLSWNLVAIGKVQTAEVCIAWNCKTYWPGDQWEESWGNIYRTSGRVGIGNNSPTTALDVNGVVRATNGLTIEGGTVSLPSESITSDFIADGTITSIDIANETLTTTNILDGTITNDDIAGNTITNSNISTSAAIDGTKILSNFGSQNLIVNGNSFYVDYLSGNVGIGTSLPASSLDVRWTIRAEVLCDEDGNNCTDLSAGFGDTIYSLDSEGGTYNNVVYVDGSANVGIGTTTPSYKLDIDGALKLYDIGSAGTPNLIIGDDAYITDIDISNFMWVYGMQDSNVWGIKLGATGWYIYGTWSNIGIGTTNPKNELHIAGWLTLEEIAPLITLEETDNSIGYRFWADGGTFLIDRDPNWDGDWSDYHRDLVLRDWKLGIGTTTPTNLLTVEGGAFALNNSWKTVRAIFNPSSSNYLSIESFNSDNTVKYPIALNAWGGKVWINTTTPSEELEVNGNVKIDGNIIFRATRYNGTPEDWQVDKMMAAMFCTAIQGESSYTRVKIWSNGDSCNTTCSGDSTYINCVWWFFLNGSSWWINTPLIYRTACSYANYTKYCCCEK